MSLPVQPAGSEGSRRRPEGAVHLEGGGVALAWMRLASAALFTLSGAVLAAVALVLLASPIPLSIGALVGDDAGYYFAIARNACLGYGFSFDRIHATNGFNPLFPWLLIPLYHLLPRDLPLAACYRIGVLVDLLAVAIAWMVFLRLLAARLARDGWEREVRLLALAAASAFFTMFIGTKSTYGMDAPLVLLLGLVYLERVNRLGPLAPGALPAVIDGLLLALLFLARVDTLPLMAAAAAAMTVEAVAARRGFRPLAVRLAVAGIASAPYLAWSITRFGTWMPVSAGIKSGFPVVDLGRSLSAIRHTSLGLHDQASFLIAWLVAWAWLALSVPRVVRSLRTRTPLEPADSAFLLFALYLAGRLTFMLLFSRADVQGSYAVLAHVFNLLAAALAIGAWMRRQGDPVRARRGAAFASLALAAVAMVLLAGKLGVARERARAAGAQGFADEVALGAEIHARTGERDVLFGGSFGLLGYFTDRSWINGDGVVNTYAYQRVFLDPGGLSDYLRSNRVTHVVFAVGRDEVLAPGPMRFDAYGLLHDRRGSVTLDARDVVLRRPVGRGGAGGGDLVLVRVPPGGPLAAPAAAPPGSP